MVVVNLQGDCEAHADVALRFGAAMHAAARCAGQYASMLTSCCA